MEPPSQMKTLENYLAHFVREGELYQTAADNKVRCVACGHRCLIPEGRPGVCRIRFNRGGRLLVPYGYTAGYHCDPIEKKPFYHVLPGETAMSFGMLGCDLHCAYCQNWETSQTLRDQDAGGRIHPMTALDFVNLAERSGARMVTSTYNEPLITSEWAVEIFRLAKEKKLYTSFVSNGNGTQEVIEYLQPWIDCYKVDLKSFQDRNYRSLGGTLEAVLTTIRLLIQMKIWVEIVTLVVPTLNDSEEELRDIARFIASVDPRIPWHITAFHEDYKMIGMGNTQGKKLVRAAEIGKEEGLSFVYVGNVPGYAPHWENTYCPKCHTLLIERCGYRIGTNRIRNGLCPQCGEAIPGIWNRV